MPTDELARLAHDRGLPLINDLGSGSLLNLSACGLPPEPTVPDCIHQGCDLVLFSGDKLLGGPQAGIIAGRKELLARIRKNPMMRAMRLDKLVYAGLEATLRLYYEPEKAMAEIPTLRELMTKPEELASRAGSLKLVCLHPAEISPQELRDRLLADSPVLIGRVENDAFCLDPRTLRDGDVPAAVALLKRALNRTNH